jgi:hypothetical protein
MADWRADDADVLSDRDENHEPLAIAPAGTLPPVPPPEEPPPSEPVRDVAIAEVNSPASAVQGDSVTIAVSLLNEGDVDESAQLVVTDITAGAQIGNVSTLLYAGAATEVAITWHTEMAAAGEHTIVAEVIVETDSDPADNTETATTFVEVSVVDVSLAGLSVPTSATVGDIVTIGATVENQGNRDIAEDVVVTITNDNATPSDASDDLVVGSFTFAGGLAVGTSQAGYAAWDSASASAGLYTLTARHSLPDDNPGNDARTSTIELTEPPPGLTVSVTTDSPTYSGRDNALITVVVTGPDGELISGATVDMVVTGSNGWSQTLYGTTNKSGQETFKTKINFRRSGSGLYAARATVACTGYSVSSASTTFFVSS